MTTPAFEQPSPHPLDRECGHCHQRMRVSVSQVSRGVGRFCSRKCFYASRSPKHQRVNTGGYVLIYRPAHPQADANGYVTEHRLVVEAAIEKVLRRSAPVHHVDLSKQNNATGNLVACHDDAYHALLHLRQRALTACGHPDWRWCSICDRWDNPAVMRLSAGSAPTSHAYHRECMKKKTREKRETGEWSGYAKFRPGNHARRIRTYVPKGSQ